MKAVDKSCVRFHNPMDPKSSSHNPVIGATIVVKFPGHSVNAGTYPGIITRVYGSLDDRVDAIIFTPTGTRYLQRIPYNSDPTAFNAWDWAEVPTRRPLEDVDAQLASVNEHTSVGG